MPRVVKPAAVIKKPAAKRKNKLYAMPEAIPFGEILTDISKTQWKIGPSIGTGGFGEIYSACRLSDAAKLKPENYDCVIKCEPHGNGPLFVEMHFYMRNAKLEDIQAFKKTHGLKTLGMPNMLGNGSHELNGQKHRFIVMPRYGKDIMKFFLENARKIPEATIYRLAIQMIDVYEFVHNCGYVHADLKGANILLGFGKNGASQAYLVDFGLASHYTTKDFKPDPKKMHNGTIEYTSRDAHQGVATMRADFEILGYNMIEWSGVALPWVRDNLLSTPVKVQKAKEELMSDIDGNIVKLYSKAPPAAIVEYMILMEKLKYNERPDYQKFRKIFLNALKLMKISNTGDLDFKLRSTSLSGGMLNIKDTYTSNDIDSPPPTPKGKKTNVKSKPEIVATIHKVKTPNKLEETPEKKPKTTKKIRSDDGETRSTPISLNANINFSPVVRLRHEKYSKKRGRTIVNDDNTSSPKHRNGSTYEINVEVNVDTNIVLNVKRKKPSTLDSQSSSSIVDRENSPIRNIKIRKIDIDSVGGSTEEDTKKTSRRQPRTGTK